LVQIRALAGQLAWKIEATERSLCNIELKSGTLVITCSAASYEILKKSIYEYYDL
jgi:hypothetical protein